MSSPYFRDDVCIGLGVLAVVAGIAVPFYLHGLNRPPKPKTASVETWVPVIRQGTNAIDFGLMSDGTMVWRRP